MVVAACAAAGIGSTVAAVVFLPRLVAAGHLSVRDAILLTGTVLVLGMAIAAALLVGGWRRRIRDTMRREEKASTDLREAARLRSAFLAGVSHELRTPLTNIVGFARTIQLRRGDMSSELLTDVTERLVNNATRLEQLVLDLLDLHRPTAQPAGRRQRRRVDELVRAATARVGDDLLLTVDAPPTTVEVDPAMVRRIVVELLSNVERHTPCGTRACLRAEVTPDGQLRVIVEDDGPGIESSRVEALLQPFVQGSHTSDEASPGLGIGFALVDRYTAALGGTWEVTTPPDGGTRVVVEVPVHVPAMQLDRAV